MGLKIPIDHKKLVDSPYTESNKNLFEYTTSDTEGFVLDIINGTPSSYLISGYRGAGKSSFIRKLEADIKEKDENILFVYLNFAKHEKRSILLRKMIRNFYLCSEEKKIFEKLKQKDELKKPINQFRELYERTFYEVSKNTNERKTTTVTSILGYEVNLKDLFLTAGSILFFLVSLFKLDLTRGITYIPTGVSVLLGILQFGYLEKKKTTENTNTDEVSKNSFYDDEIAEHYITEVLISFQNHIKPVFVLDELDKINDDELVENLINELKPIMLSGLASFIVVAGQNLYYNYYLSQTKDDGALSSLFSKVHHVPLFSISELRILFSRLIQLDSIKEEEIPLVDAYVDFLIFEAKRVPRRFIILLRQNIIWEDKQAFIEIDKSIAELIIYSKILNRIEKIDDQEIAHKDYPEAIRDYFNMQLLLKSHKILKNQNMVFTAKNI